MMFDAKLKSRTTMLHDANIMLTQNDNTFSSRFLFWSVSDASVKFSIALARGKNPSGAAEEGRVSKSFLHAEAQFESFLSCWDH